MMEAASLPHKEDNMNIVTKEFIYSETLPTPECHASTLLLLEDGGAIAAWFGGTKEGEADVRIWYSRRENGAWSVPEALPSEDNIQHWNPVLHTDGEGAVHLYYKKGFPIPRWRTVEVVSRDGGRSWSAPREVVEGDVSGGRGPVKNKPITLPGGRLLAPASTEQGKWRCFIDIFDGDSWQKHPIPMRAEDEESVGLIQPSLWADSEGAVHALMRSDAGRIYRSDSLDGGETWCAAYPTPLPNNNSGLDCVMTDKGLALVCNPVGQNWGPRTPLSLFISHDNGESFRKLIDLETEEGEYSYPAIVCRSSRVGITYTHRRKKIAFWEIEL